MLQFIYDYSLYKLKINFDSIDKINFHCNQSLQINLLSLYTATRNIYFRHFDFDYLKIYSCDPYDNSSTDYFQFFDGFHLDITLYKNLVFLTLVKKIIFNLIKFEFYLNNKTVNKNNCNNDLTIFLK